MPPIILTEIETFVLKRKQQFENFHKNEKTNMNENISDELYKKNELKEIMKDPHNKFEQLWKTRILMDYTPNGNIIMFYDLYKNAFSYYCDNSCVSHNVLNAVAMKYTMQFVCVDFYMEQWNEEKNTTPFAQYILDDEMTDIKIKKKVFNSLSHQLGNEKLPFAKLQKNRLNTSLSTIQKTEKIINKFIYLGKINNFSFIRVGGGGSGSGDFLKFKKVNYSDYKLIMKKKQ